jgi:hypothetical protein
MTAQWKHRLETGKPVSLCEGPVPATVHEREWHDIWYPSHRDRRLATST